MLREFYNGAGRSASCVEARQNDCYRLPERLGDISANTRSAVRQGAGAELQRAKNLSAACRVQRKAAQSDRIATRAPSSEVYSSWKTLPRCSHSRARRPHFDARKSRAALSHWQSRVGALVDRAVRALSRQRHAGPEAPREVLTCNSLRPCAARTKQSKTDNSGQERMAHLRGIAHWPLSKFGGNHGMIVSPSSHLGQQPSSFRE